MEENKGVGGREQELTGVEQEKYYKKPRVEQVRKRGLPPPAIELGEKRGQAALPDLFYSPESFTPPELFYSPELFDS